MTAREAEVARKPGFYADGNGLYLRVTPTGTRSWVYRYMLDGRRRDMGLGPYPLISLAAARERVTTARLLKHDGTDPLEQRHAATAKRRVAKVKAITFNEAWQAYYRAHRPGWRSDHATQWRQSLEAYADPVIGDLPVAAIDTALVMKVIEPVWAKKTETANRVRARLEAVLGWAATAGYRQAADNPARWRGHLENLLPKRSRVQPIEHFPAMPFAEIAAFMVELRAAETISARALEFCILNAARTGEVIGARWDEIDLVGRMWTIAASRMKGGREHRVPLSDAAMAIIARMAATRENEFVFPGRGIGQPISKTMLMKTLLGITGRKGLTVHGFRSAFRDWCSETTSFPAEVVEMALAHAVSNRVEAAYRRGDLFNRRRKLSEAWARYCIAPASPVPLSVTKLRA